MSNAAHELAHTTIATWTLAIQRALLTSGIEADTLLREVGIDAQSIRDPEQRVTVATMWRLWRLSVAHTGNDAFGLLVAESLYPTHLNALLSALQASSTLRECLQRLQRYVRVVTTIAQINVIEDAQGVRLVFCTDSSATEQRPYQPVDAFMGVLFRTLQGLLGDCAAGTLLEVQLRRPSPQNLADFEQFFRVPLHFSCAEDGLLLGAQMMDRELPAANSVIARMNDQLLTEYLGRLRKEHISLQVRREIIALLGSESLGLEQIAERLNMSGRNLHRKLAEEGTSFKELQEEIRRDLALRYLTMPTMSLNEIAYSLGFIDQSSFNRAFKRWTGGSPGQYRRALKDRS